MPKDFPLREIESFIQQVDAEILYKHILMIEGCRHPFENADKLDEVTNYIKNEFRKYGLQASEQEFKIVDCSMIFKNVIGTLNQDKESTILITSHYDTVSGTPGANDNGSGIAVMLEAARVLAKVKLKYNVQFISFSLEEPNPIILKMLEDKARSLGLMDEQNRYLNYHTQKIMETIENLAIKYLRKGISISKISEKIYSIIKTELSPAENEFIEALKSIIKNLTISQMIGSLMNIGSNKYVEKILEERKKIEGVIDLECVGYTFYRKYSQEMNTIIPIIFPSYKMKMLKKIGNFIAIIGDRNSKKLARVFYKQCRKKGIDLPAVSIAVPFTFEQITKWPRDLLRSDHAPFWRVKIPALMVTDTANLRNPYYHTQADTIDKLDFEFMQKVCKATIATVINIV